MNQPDDLRHQPAETLPQALGRLRVALQDAYLQASRTLGLTAQQAELLCAAMAPAAVGDLAQALRCDRSNVSHLVDRAAARGLVNRNISDADGRVTVVTLTAEGERLAQRFLAELEAQTRPLHARWPDQRQQLAVELLNEISDTLDSAASQTRAARGKGVQAGTRRRGGAGGSQPAAEAPHSLAEPAAPRPGPRLDRWGAPVPGPPAAPSPHLSEHLRHPQGSGPGRAGP